MTTTPMLQASQLSVSYGSSSVLRGLDLEVRSGEIYALLGGNGAGKSTTMNVFLGFVTPAAGTASVDGIDVAADPVGARRRMAYVPESVALYEPLTARENLGYFLQLAQATAPDARQVDEALAAVQLERAAWDRRVSGFSKGMRQRVAIALALARSVPVLLLDEPTTGLDPQSMADFNELLSGLRQQGVAILIVTHDMLMAAEIADRVGFLRNGRIAHELHAGSNGLDPSQLYRHVGANGAGE